MTYDVIDYNGQLEDAGVHTILFKPSQQALGRLLKQRIEGKLTVITRVKCTPQHEHIAEAIYLHHRKYLKNIATVHDIGEAAARQTNRPAQGRYEEYRLLAIAYTTDSTCDTSFTLNYPKHTNTPNIPFTLVAGDKDTLISSGLDVRATRDMPDLLAARPIYRPDLNLTRDNMSSQCIFVKPKPDAPGWHTPAAIERSHQWHRDLTQSEDQVEMQIKPAFQWANEQQTLCKIAIIQLQGGGGDQERMIRNVLNAAGIKYTINRQMATLRGNLSGLEEVRLQLLQNSIKLPMTPTEGASQLTIHQVTKADVSQEFQGVQYFCKIGTIEYLSTV